MSKKEFEIKSDVELNDVVGYLEGIVKGLKATTLYIEKGEESIFLSPEREIVMEIKGYQKETKESLSISLTWHKALPEPEKEPLDLTISSNPPKKEEKKDKKKEEKKKDKKKEEKKKDKKK